MRSKIVEEARSWLGVRWRHQGRTRHGVDCAGLVVQVGKALGLTEFDMTNYGRRPDSMNFAKFFVDGGAVSKSVAAALPGDILLFRDGYFPCHCGILTPDGTFVHAFATRRAVVEDPLDPGWLAKRTHCFSYGGV